MLYRQLASRVELQRSHCASFSTLLLCEDQITLHVLLHQTTVCYCMCPRSCHPWDKASRKEPNTPPSWTLYLPACAGIHTPSVSLHVPTYSVYLSTCVRIQALFFASCHLQQPLHSQQRLPSLCVLVPPSSIEGRWLSNCPLSIFPH